MQFYKYLCNISHGFSLHGSSRSPSAIVELLVIFLFIHALQVLFEVWKQYWHIFYRAMCSFLLFLVFQLILHFPWLSIQIKFSGVFQFSLMIWNPYCQKIRLMTGHRDPVRHHCQHPVLHPCQHRVDDTVPSSDSCSGHAELQPVMSSGYTAWCNLVNKHAPAHTIIIYWSRLTIVSQFLHIFSWWLTD